MEEGGQRIEKERKEKKEDRATREEQRGSDNEFVCMLCKHSLFVDNKIQTHMPPPKPKRKFTPKISLEDYRMSQIGCTSYYVEEPLWFKPEVGSR